MSTLTQCPLIDPAGMVVVRCVRPVEIPHNTHEGWLPDGTLHRWQTGEALIETTYAAFTSARGAYLAAVQAHLRDVARTRWAEARYIGVNVTLVQASRAGESFPSLEVTGIYAATLFCDCGCPRCEAQCPCAGRSRSDGGLMIAQAFDGEFDSYLDVLAEHTHPSPDDHVTYAYDLESGQWRTDIPLNRTDDES